MAQVLKDNGYRTYISGKWHLGLTPESNAHAKGFDHSFTLLQGLDHHFKQSPSAFKTKFNLYRRWANYYQFRHYLMTFSLPTILPINYSATLDSGKNSGKPFFAYAAYTAPHWPIQAPAEYREKYRGVYDVGYDAIRNARISRQKQLGIIPANFDAAEPIATQNAPQKYGKWDELTAEQKALEARKMEIYAGMVENLDANVGRIIQYLKQNNLYDNTLIFFVSDNGAEGFVRGGYGSESGFDNSVANVGTPTSYHYIGPRWAEVSAAPFHLWKDTAGEGATTAPAIVKLPNQKKAEATNHKLCICTRCFPYLTRICSYSSTTRSI
ncbi:sulfatase-like hydrolase/transferase [Acinetobacter pittii]